MSRTACETLLFSVVIPVFNEERSVCPVVDQVRSLYPNAEIIVVDDGSLDGTAQKLAGVPVRILRHERNCGYGAAIKTGIAAATHDIIVTIDADGEHLPEDIGSLVSGLAGVDMTVGARGEAYGSGLFKIIGRLVLNEFACFLASARIPDINSGLRAFGKKAVLRHLTRFPNTYSFHTTSTLVILFCGGRIKYMPVHVCPRIGVSKVRLRDGVISLAFVTALAARYRPLRLWSGVLMAFMLIAGGVVVIVAPGTSEGMIAGIGSVVLMVVIERLSRDGKGGSGIVKENRLG